MKIERIHFYRDEFKKHKLDLEILPVAYKWECQEIFQNHWDIEALDFAEMFDKALSHPTSGRLWGGNHQSAKSIMLEFIQLNREFVRSMFKDLFSRQKDILMRIERFQFHCDQLMEELQSRNRRVNHHFHHDYYMPTLYLSFKYPTENCVFDPAKFQKCLTQIGAKDPVDNTLDRFGRVIPILRSQLLQDIELKTLLQQKIKLNLSELYNSHWLTYEYYTFIADEKS